MNKIKETDLKNQILDYLKLKGIYSWLTNTQGNYNPRTNSYYKNPRLLLGVSDIVGIMSNGQMLTIECKVGKNKQSEAQKDFQINIEKNNGLYILAYSLDEVIKQLTK